jgi:hypothetical protein
MAESRWRSSGDRSALRTSRSEPAGLYYIEGRSGASRGSFAFQYLDLEFRKVSLLFRREGPIYLRSLSVSPDEKWLLYEEAPLLTSELMLVENFR